MTGSANFNGHPTPETIRDYEEDMAQISLGSMTKYTKRFSMFRLYARAQGAIDWTDITGSAPFAVRGVSPMAQYNTIHIDHPDLNEPTVHEYRIVPVPGSAYYNVWNSGGGVSVHLLDGAMLQNANTDVISLSGYKVRYTGHRTSISAFDANNPEWIMNDADGLDRIARGPIATLNRYNNGVTPLPPQVALPDKPLGKKYVASGSQKSLVEIRANREPKNRRYYWEGKLLSGTEIRPGALRVQAGAKVYLYEESTLVFPYEAGGWEDAKNTPQYLVVDDPQRPYEFDYIYAVYREPGTNRWIYRWNNVTQITRNGKTTGWVELSRGMNRFRMGEKVTDESFTYYDYPGITDLYYASGNNDLKLDTGARLLDDGKTFEFWRGGRRLGINLGNGRNFYPDSAPNEGNRWRATTRMQKAVAYSEESLGSTRDADDERDGKLDTCVNTGCAVNGEITITGNNGQELIRQELIFYLDGERIYQGPDRDRNGNEPIVRIGDVRYEWGKSSEPLYCGRVDAKKPVYKLRQFAVTDKQYEQWSVTYQLWKPVAESYIIEKQTLEPEVYGHRYIEKTSIERTEDETPTLTIEPIYGTKVEGEEQNTSAVATVRTYSNGAVSWDETLVNAGEGYEVGERVRIGKRGPVCDVLTLQSDNESDDSNNVKWEEMTAKGYNYFALNAVCDYYINGTDTSSHANGPEHNVVFCNEIIKQSGNDVPKYTDLALCGLKITNSKEWTNFSNLSAWLAKGMSVKRLVSSSAGPTNLFPEIAWTLLTDKRIGAGELVGEASVNRDAMVLAAQYCQANNFYWDGVIDDSLNLRNFIFEQAAYILCDFTIVGGQFALVPSFPLGSDKRINQKGKPDIRALFTDANMRGMEVSFLSPEERQPFTAVVMYREEKVNGFSEVRTLKVRLAAGSETDPVEEFDLTQFCTSPSQAEWFARIALKLRKEVDHGIKFETTPQSAMNLEPGQYFRVASKVSHTDRFQSGVVDDRGNVISSESTTAGSFQVIYWRPGETTTRQGTLSYSNNKTGQSTFHGCLWAKVQESENTRTYKVETLQYSDEGLVEVAGSYVPLTASGTMAVLDWGDSDFVSETA